MTSFSSPRAPACRPFCVIQGYIQCETCQAWLHFECAGTSPDTVTTSGTFECRDCAVRTSTSTVTGTPKSNRGSSSSHSKRKQSVSAGANASTAPSSRDDDERDIKISVAHGSRKVKGGGSGGTPGKAKGGTKGGGAAAAAGAARHAMATGAGSGVGGGAGGGKNRAAPKRTAGPGAGVIDASPWASLEDGWERLDPMQKK